MRLYDPITGRWLSKDPIGISGGLNQYVFCGNNPVMFVDPMGLDHASTIGPWTFYWPSYHELSSEQQEAIRIHEQVHAAGTRSEVEAYREEMFYGQIMELYYRKLIEREQSKPKPDTNKIREYRNRMIAYYQTGFEAQAMLRRQQEQSRKPWFTRYMRRVRNFYGGESEE